MNDLAFCDNWAERFIGSRYSDLSEGEREALYEHLYDCHQCVAAYANYRLMGARIRSLPQAEPLPSLISQLQQVKQNTARASSQFDEFPAQDAQIGIAADAVQHISKDTRSDWFEQASARFIQMVVQCSGRFVEVLPYDLEAAEVLLEDQVSHTLLSLFDKGGVEAVDVVVRFHPDQPEPYTLLIEAKCPARAFPVHPNESERVELAVEDAVSCALLELFGEVILVEGVSVDRHLVETGYEGLLGGAVT